MAVQLPGVLESIAPVLNRYGYVAILGLIGVEGFGVPAPGQIVLVAAGIYAGAGELNLAAVLILGLVAAVVGDNIGYALGRYGGRPLVRRFGRYVFIPGDRLATMERFFARRGNIVVPAARFVDGLRQANGIVAGLAQMGWWRFLTYNILGATAWVGVWVLVGYLAADHIAPIYTGVQRYQKYVLTVLAVLVIAAVARLVWRRRRPGQDSAQQSACAESAPGRPA